MMRRRPTAVYRVLDEEDLLAGADYVDGTTPWPVDEDLDPADREAPVAARGRAVDDVRGQSRGRVSVRWAGSSRGSADADRPAVRGRTLWGCAGALLLAVLLTRVASVLLAGAGGARGGGRHAGGQQAAVAHPAVAAAGAVGPSSLNPGRPAAGGGTRGAAPEGSPLTTRPGISRRPGARPSDTAGAPRLALVDNSRRALTTLGAPALVVGGDRRLGGPSPNRPVGGRSGASRIGSSVSGRSPMVSAESVRLRRPGAVSSARQEFGFER